MEKYEEEFALKLKNKLEEEKIKKEQATIISEKVKEIEELQIIKDYLELKKQEQEFSKYLTISEDQMVLNAYKNLNVEFDNEIYVYLASFKQLGIERSIDDTIVDRDSSQATYSVYGVLKGADRRVYVPIDKRDEFESQENVLKEWLKDYNSYSEYYNLRTEYLKSLVEEESKTL